MVASTSTVDQTRTRRQRRWWLTGAVAGAGYGLFLIVAALGLPAGTPLTGQFAGQPVAKAVMALALAAAASLHPIVRERRWLVGALLFSAAGDVLLAMPWWQPSFVAGLAAFLVAHLCYLGALLPLRKGPIGRSPARLTGVAVVVLSCAALLIWFWPHLAADGLTIPVTLYVTVLGAMVCAALLAQLPTPWVALGAVCFAVSDSMIGISEFIRQDQLLALPIWWAYGLSQVMITAGFFFGRSRR